MKSIIVYVAALMILLHTSAVEAQFGKNKVNYNSFDFEFIETEHFDIYFTENGYDTALIASEIAEESYSRISQHWNYIPTSRTPILVYNSHNDFSQNNVILEILSEGTGGFTELFKNRVVVPWEGSLAKFRHVIHHELTHAFFFDMLYGGVIDSIVGREYLFQLPLWFAEGLAEHESQYWSSEADMIVRDGIISGYLPQIQNIYGGYLVYKGGESFFKYIQEEYGSSETWMAGEILHSLSRTKNLDKSYKALTGKGIEELSKEWHRSLRTDHWPEVAGREIADDFALKLTDHMELQNYLNVTPSFNPTGDRIAFLTDRNGYNEILLMSSIDGKIIDTLIRGEKAGDYEEMHWLRSGITWSPDGTMVAFAAKAGERDAIHIKKAEDGGYDKMIIPDMDAVYTPDWSPDGKSILFSGMKAGKSDLYVLDIETEVCTRITDDIFDEQSPRWSPDGTKIVFSSDRVDAPYKHAFNDMDGNYDIFTMNANGEDIQRIASNPYHDRTPSWSPDGKMISFVSDRNGIDNVYYINLDDMAVTPLTNLLTASASPCWSPDGNRIAFTSFKQGGWDIYLLKRPLQRDIKPEAIPPTQYRIETEKSIAEAIPENSSIILEDIGYGQEIAIEPQLAKPYKIKFSPDSFNAFASYNTFYGVGGMGQLSLSDILGNHRINIGANLYYSLEESDMLFSYFYLKKKTNYGINLFHYKTYYRSQSWDIFSDRIYGGSLSASHPFNMFTRQDFSLNVLNIQRNSFSSSYYWDPYYQQYQSRFTEGTKLEGVSTVTLQTEYVRDNTLWGYTGPLDGVRYKINIEHSPSISLTDLAFTTMEVDFRKYFRFGNNYNFVTRFSGGGSFGDDPRLFFMGGTNNWLNARIAYISDYLESRQDIFFARFPFPLRGYKYYEEFGRQYFLTNFEFRFPFIDYLAIRWPLPIVLGNINGVLFSDIGSAWNKPSGINPDSGETIYDKSFHGGGQNSSGAFYLDDIKMSYGFGMRINLGFAVLRMDTAWQTTIEHQDPSPMFSVSVGPDF